MKKILKYTFRFFLILLGIIIILVIALIGFQEKIDYQNTAKFQKAIKNVPQFISKAQNSKDSLKVGWAKINITPNQPMALAGYGSRGKYKEVHDSLYARIFMFELDKEEYALISLDLLLFPPKVREQIEEKLATINLKKENIFYSAIHTHNGFGAWETSFAGSFMAGSYQQSVVDNLEKAVLKGIKQARKHKQYATLAFGKIYMPKYVENRMADNQEAKTDNYLRFIKIKQEKGKQAIIFSYAAHAICLSSKLLVLSRDYPGQAVKYLEKTQKVDFACFVAGMVGGHGPRFVANKHDFQFMEQMGKSLADTILHNIDSLNLKKITKVQSAEIPVPISNPQFRLGNTFKIRNWAFRTFLGNPKVSLKILKLGNILLVGTPCDFSGELSFPLIKKAEKEGLDLMITSFNGNYMGYVTPDSYYKTYRTEVREMNWFGPTGQYFQDLILKVIEEVK